MGTVFLFLWISISLVVAFESVTGFMAHKILVKKRESSRKGRFDILFPLYLLILSLLLAFLVLTWRNFSAMVAGR